MLKLRITILMALLIALAAASSAAAGTYTVSTCRSPSGGAAPVDYLSFDAYSPLVDRWSSTCPGGAVTLTMDPNVTHPRDDVLRLRFFAPPDTKIVSYKMWSSVVVGSGTQYFFTPIEWRDGTETWVGPSCKGTYCTSQGDPSKPLSDANLWQNTPDQPIDAFGLYMSCGYYNASDPACPAANPAGQASLYRADATLEDDAAPTFTAVPTGSLVDEAATQSGVVSVSVLGSDRGGGVAEGLIEVDGAIAARETLDDNGGACHTPYVVPVPCKLQTGGTVHLDTATLADGAHRVRVLLRDAAGNTTPWGPITIHTNNAAADRSCSPDPAAGAGAPRLLAWALRPRRHGHGGPRAARSVTVSFGRSPTLAGRLLDAAGNPMAGAPVCFVWRPYGSSDAFAELARTTAGPDGRFTLAVPPGPSREILAVHRAGDAAVVSRVVVRVRARVTVRPARRRLRNGDRLVLHGRVPGPIPQGGVIVQLKTWRSDKHAWQTFSNPHTRTNGTFRGTYEFTRVPPGVFRYRIRAVVPPQAGYPYALGRSRVLGVYVRG